METILCRSLNNVRNINNSRKISGYAVVFNSWSRDLGGFYEIIRDGAITKELINNSDVIMNINHDDDKMVARCVNGNGTLTLELRGDGLYFEFEAPPTQLGDELLYNVRNGNLFECSFAFSISDNSNAQRWYKDGDTLRREILSIGGLYDCAICTHAAYPETNCKVRGLQMEDIDTETIIRTLEINSLNENMDDKKIQELEEELKALREMVDELKPKEEEKPAEEPKEEEEKPAEEPKEEPKPAEEEKPAEEPKEEEKPAEQAGCGCENEEEKRNLNKNKSINRTMEKKYSLVKELRNAMETGNQINLNELEKRGYSVADNGDEVVETDLYNILDPLRAKNVLVQSGARMITGLKGNVQIPVMTATSVNWKGETSAADDGSGSFTAVKLTPKRLTAKVPISLELLAQDSIGVEDAIRRDIINAINDKLEATILGNEAGTDDKPAGLAYAVTEVKVTSFSDICSVEAAVENNNVYGDCKYIVSPSFKAGMRGMAKGTNANAGMVWQNNAIDGTDAASTTHVTNKHAIYGDFQNLVVGQFGDITLDVCRDSASLANGNVTLVVNSFWDAKPARTQAFGFAYIQ